MYSEAHSKECSTKAMLSVKSVPIFTAILFLSTTRSHGKIATNGQFPWSVYIMANYTIRSYEPEIHEWNCTGTIISERLLITSGDCVIGSDKFRIRAGPYYINGTCTTCKTLKFVHDVILHKAAHVSEDAKLAIIETGFLTFGPYINKVDRFIPPLNPLDGRPIGSSDPEIRSLSATSGHLFGYAVNEDNKLELQYYTYFIPDLGVCFRIFRHQPEEFEFRKKFCANDDQNNRNLCSPRSFGAGLIGADRTLVGVAIEECVPGGPQKFARISNYKKWIDQLLLAEILAYGDNSTHAK